MFQPRLCCCPAIKNEGRALCFIFVVNEHSQKQKSPERLSLKGFDAIYSILICYLAEKEGFEPPVPCGTTVFKTAALDRSAISPGAKVLIYLISESNDSKILPYPLSSCT
jgi:hypothetical protein